MLTVGFGLLGAIVVFLGITRFRAPAPMSRPEFLATLDEFIDGGRGAEEWDAFCERPVADPDLLAAQRALACIDDQYPPERPGALCNDKGVALLRRWRDELSTAKAA